MISDKVNNQNFHSAFVADGSKRVAAEVRASIKGDVKAKFSKRMMKAGWFGRPRLRREMSTLLAVMLLAPFSPITRADDSIFGDIEQIHASAVARIVQEHKRDDRHLAIMFADMDRRDGATLDKPLWRRLKKRLEARLSPRTRSGFVPAEQVAWRKQRMQYYHKPAGKDAWVYSIGSVEWHGANTLHMPIWVGHGVLAGGGETLVFAKSGETWRIVGRTDECVW